jgi:hypothetical protein
MASNYLILLNHAKSTLQISADDTIQVQGVNLTQMMPHSLPS